MDILTNTNYFSADYICRYSSVPYYYNTEDRKYIYGIGTNMVKTLPYVAHKVKDTDTLDYLALKYYNNPTYYWVIAYFNDIQDAFIKLSDKFKILKIPNIRSLEFGDLR